MILFASSLFFIVGCQAVVKNSRVADSVDFTFESNITHVSYSIHVYMPANIDQIDGKLPVVYETDAQWNFKLLKDKLKARQLNAIVVGIDGGKNDQRAVDYRMPGAADYYQFLTKELIPEIEQRYKADPKNRTIMGHSYGGLFVGLCMLFDSQKGQFFTNYWSFDGSFLELKKSVYLPMLQNQSVNSQFRGNLMLSGATQRGNGQFVSFWEHAVKPFFPHLKTEKKLFDVYHDSAVGPSLDWVLEDYALMLANQSNQK